MLEGVFTAMVTPFNEDGSVDYDAFQRLVVFLCENGSDGVVVAGTTGEEIAQVRGCLERLSLLVAA